VRLGGQGPRPLPVPLCGEGPQRLRGQGRAEPVAQRSRQRPLTPEGRPRSLARRAAEGTAAAQPLPPGSRHLLLVVVDDRFALVVEAGLVVDWGQHVVGGVTPAGVVVIDPGGHRPARLFVSVKVTATQQLPF
jgi:hypothetical protein